MNTATAAAVSRIISILGYTARGKSVFADTVDELGRVKSDIAELQGYEKDLKEDLVASGEPAIDGRMFRATVSLQSRTTTDYKAVIADLMATGRVSMKVYNESLERHTKVGAEFSTVKVVAR
jgi:hypothetical protein